MEHTLYHTSVLSLVEIVGLIGPHEGVSSWLPMYETLLNSSSMLGDLAAELDSSQLLHMKGSCLD